MKRVTQLSLTGSGATDDAKFLIISLVGGIWRAVSSSIYLTSSSSCCGVSFCCAIACSLRERVSPLYVRVNVDCTTLCFAAILDQGISSLDAKVLHSASASSNPIALWCYRVESTEVFWWFGALRESAHCAHGHGSARAIWRYFTFRVSLEDMVTNASATTPAAEKRCWQTDFRKLLSRVLMKDW